MRSAAKFRAAKTTWRWGLAALVIGLTSCGGGDGGSAAVGAAFLHVSISEFYFGTRNVGTTAVQRIELANRSGDVYPINRLTLKGKNADEFNTNFAGGITLNPSQKIEVDVSFSPLSNGTKNAVLDIDYEIIKLVTEQQNLDEQSYYEARELEDAGDYAASRSRYHDYLAREPVTVNKTRAAIKLPVLDESERLGGGAELQLYLQALNSRNDGTTAQSLQTLETLVSEAPDSFLADDAIYLQGYIQLIDHEDAERAAVTMSQLRKQFPDSSYYDTALYSEALAHEQMGDYVAAKRHFEELISRHRSETWARINLNMPKDEIVARMWFERANQGLARLDQTVS